MSPQSANTTKSGPNLKTGISTAVAKSALILYNFNPSYLVRIITEKWPGKIGTAILWNWIIFIAWSSDKNISIHVEIPFKLKTFRGLWKVLNRKARGGENDVAKSLKKVLKKWNFWCPDKTRGGDDNLYDFHYQYTSVTKVLSFDVVCNSTSVENFEKTLEWF